MARIKYQITNSTENKSKIIDVVVNKSMEGMKYAINIDNTDYVSYLAKENDTPEDILNGLESKLKSQRSLSVKYNRLSLDKIRFESEFEGFEFDLSVDGNGIQKTLVQSAEQSRPVPLPFDWLEGRSIDPGGTVSRIVESESISEDQSKRLDHLLSDGLIELNREAVGPDESERTDSFDQSEAKMIYYDSFQSGLSADNVQDAIDSLQTGSVNVNFHKENFEPSGGNDTSYQLNNNPIPESLSVSLNGIRLSQGQNNDYELNNDEIEFIHPLLKEDFIEFMYVSQ